MDATKIQEPRRQISVRLPKSLILKAKVKAAEEEGSVQDIIERALRRELK